jgi:predicted nucleotidyltransferase component of viral defense system
LAQARGENFDLVLTRYVLERLLFRLSQSTQRDRFVLKGAMLYALWYGQSYRATRDLDLLGYGSSVIADIEKAFRDICQTNVINDGLVFDPETIRGVSIRDQQEYGGVRITLTAHLAGARIRVQIDIGFGDIITPAPEEIDYPTLLDFPAARVRAYPRTTVVAEKFQALVMLGMVNTRMKDFYDLCWMARQFDFDGATLRDAIKATFARRETALPLRLPIALTPEFANDAAKQKQWQAFVKRLSAEGEATALADAVALIQEFLMSPTLAAAHLEAFPAIWPAGGPWRFSE